MYLKPLPQNEMEDVIRQAVEIAKGLQQQPPPKPPRNYDRLLRQIHTYYYPQLYSYVKFKVWPKGTHEDVEDICSNVLVEIFANLHPAFAGHHSSAQASPSALSGF